MFSYDYCVHYWFTYKYITYCFIIAEQSAVSVGWRTRHAGSVLLIPSPPKVYCTVDPFHPTTRLSLQVRNELVQWTLPTLLLQAIPVLSPKNSASNHNLPSVPQLEAIHICMIQWCHYSHPIPSHHITSHPIPSHPIPSHPIPSYHITSHHITSRVDWLELNWLVGDSQWVEWYTIVVRFVGV